MVEEIRKYLFEIKLIDENNRINVDFLSEKPTEFAIVPVPINPILETYRDGSSKRQFQFQLLSCNSYGADVLQNISNSSFYEDLYNLIEYNSKHKIRPKIKGIQSIECLDNGGILDASPNTAKYAILMRITYIKFREGLFDETNKIQKNM